MGDTGAILRHTDCITVGHQLNPTAYNTSGPAPLGQQRSLAINRTSRLSRIGHRPGTGQDQGDDDRVDLNRTGKEVIVPLSLKGFTKGLSALKAG